MPRDLFAEAGIAPTSTNKKPRDLFQEANISIDTAPKYDMISEMPKEEDTFLQSLARYGLKDPAVGVTKLGHQIHNLPHDLLNLVAPVLAEKLPYEKDYDIDKFYSKAFGVKDRGPNLGSSAIQILPEIIASLAVPETKIPYITKALSSMKGGKYLQAGLGNALSQGGVAALFNPENALSSAGTAAAISGPLSALGKLTEAGSPSFRRISQGALGAGIGAGTGSLLPGNSSFNESVGAILGALLGGRGNLRNAAQDIKENVAGTNYKENLQRAKDLGLKYLTPAEAAPESPILGRQQGALARSVEGGKTLYNAGQERIGSEKEVWQKILNDIYNPEESASIKESAYKVAHNTKVPDDFITKFEQNPIIAQGIEDVATNRAFQKELEGVSADSLKYWDYVKKAVNDREKRLPQDSEERKILSRARNEMVRNLDEVAPEYKEGRRLAELEKTKDKLVKSLNKSDIRGTSIQNVLKNDTKFDKLMYSLRTMPQAQENLKKLRIVSKNLINPPTVRTTAGMGAGGMFERRNTSDALKEELLDKFSNIFKLRSDSSRIADLLTNPNWDEEITKILAPSSAEKNVGKGVNAFGKVLSQTAANNGGY